MGQKSRCNLAGCLWLGVRHRLQWRCSLRLPSTPDSTWGESASGITHIAFGRAEVLASCCWSYQLLDTSPFPSHHSQNDSLLLEEQGLQDGKRERERRKEREREGERERERDMRGQKLQPFCNLILELTYHHSTVFCSLEVKESSPHTRGADYTRVCIPGGKNHWRLS